MVKHVRFATLMCGICAVVTFLYASDKSTKPLQSVLNKTNYNLVYPATSDVFAGGILVSDNKHSSFYGLPPTVSTPETQPVTAAWGQGDISSSFSLQALLGGLGKLITGGLGVGKSSTLKLSQINASGAEVTNAALSTLSQNPDVVRQVNTWLGLHYRVYIVHTALATTSISINTTGNVDVTAAFGSSLPKCPAAPASNSSTSNPQGTSGSNATGTGGTSSGQNGSGSPTSASTSGAGKTPAKTTTAASTSKSSPTVSLQACYNSSTSLSLTTDKPLVFAASLNPFIPMNGSLQVGPVLTLVTGGAVREPGQPKPPATLNWQAVAWPTAK
jgi:hypothetical protein